MIVNTIKSEIYYRLRKIFTKLYPFLKEYDFILGTILYESKLLDEISIVIKKKTMSRGRKGILPQGYGIGLSERCVEIPWFFAQLDSKKTLHMDAGSSLNFRTVLELDPLKNKKIIIVNLNPETNCYSNQSISYMYWDLRKPLFQDNTFDSISCISVLEHIGMDTSGYTHQKEFKENKKQDYLMVVKDFKRILKPNGKCYITVPYGKFKDHTWFQVFDTSMVNMIISVFNPSSCSVTYFMNTKKGWKYSNKKESNDSLYSGTYKPNYTVGSTSVACISLVKKRDK